MEVAGFDKRLVFFERWLPGHLASIGNRHHRRMVNEFATWKVQPWLRTRTADTRQPPQHRDPDHAGHRVPGVAQ
ncbi:hypothetical protein [Nocardia sp. SC052]|uniref:hypothetical protein n=1 Tax=Nocardia sichangensis TaxID=3385975 RepID=UPI0039A365AD